MWTFINVIAMTWGKFINIWVMLNLENLNVSLLLSQGKTMLSRQKISMYICIKKKKKMNQTMITSGQLLRFPVHFLCSGPTVIKHSECLLTFPLRKNELKRKTHCLPFSYISHCNLIIWFSGLCIYPLYVWWWVSSPKPI